MPIRKTMKTTCLHSHHIALNALMSPFAGYDMPISYEGIEAEHNAVRNNVGVFDVSHMGEVHLAGDNATETVNHIFCGDVRTLNPGQVVYGMLTNHSGGVVDDLLVYKFSDTSYLLVINAANIEKDLAWIRENVLHGTQVTDLCEDTAELAIQGPKAEETMLNVLGVDCSDLGFYTFKVVDLHNGARALVSRTGYTGEDGFEFYAAENTIIDAWEKLMAAGVAPCGLGCRDTLRFEAGLPLYGNELTDDITPIMAGLSMFAKLDKEEFIGRDALIDQKAQGPAKRVIGLEIDGKAIARHGYDVLDLDGNKVGTITTGYHSISLDRNLAMALVDTAHAKLDTPLQVQVRRKVFPAKVIKKRFYTPNYKK